MLLAARRAWGAGGRYSRVWARSLTSGSRADLWPVGTIDKFGGVSVRLQAGHERDEAAFRSWLQGKCCLSLGSPAYAIIVEYIVGSGLPCIRGSSTFWTWCNDLSKLHMWNNPITPDIKRNLSLSFCCPRCNRPAVSSALPLLLSPI